MADNQAAREGDDALGFLRDAVQAVQTPQAPRREDVMGDALRTLGIDAKPQKPTPAPSPEISGEQAASSRQANIATMMGRYLQSNPTSSPLRAAAGLMGDMAFAGLGGQIKGDADPLAIRTAAIQEGATAIVGSVFGDTIGDVAGSVIGGMANAGATAQKTVGQAVNTATRWYTGGRDVFDLDISDRTKQFLSGGYSSRNALMDSAPENRARFIRSNASEAEAAAATGMSSPMAFNVGDAMGQIGLAVLSSLIPGGQAAGAANAAKATTTFGKAFNAVRTWTSNPGAKLYLGYAGAQSGIGMSAEMDAFRRRENEAIDLYNESIERLGLPFEKRGPVEYDRLMDMGVSVASGIGTAALETVTVGLAKFGGGRIARRMMFGKAETLGGIRDVIRASVTGFAIGGAGESLEEALDVYKDGFLRGIWNPYEEARFLRTFKGEDFWKTLKAYAPEAIDAAVTSFIAAGPLGGAGGAASVRRSGAATVAFHHAFMRDQMSREQGSGPDVIASGLVARQIAERVMLGNADPQVQKVVLEQLRSTGLAEAGSVTAEQMTDPEWVRSFVRRNPLLAAAIADRFDSLSRSNVEWMTGPASRGRVPNADQRQQFLNMVKGEVRSMVPAYMRGWADRAARRYSELARTVDEISREMSGLEGEALEQAYARRLAAHAEMSEIRQINDRMKAARVRGEVPTEQEFREWQVLTAEVEAVDLDGTADAEADSPATEALEAAAAPEQAAPEQAEQPPMSEAKRLRILAREGDPDAAFRLAEMHETGEGAERHAAKAEYWLNVALAAQGDADALFYLGEFYRLRVQSESGLKKAIVLLSRAARAGSTRAQAALGEVQAQRGNVAKASDLFRKAGQDGSKGIARLVLTGQLPPSEISTELIQSLEQLSLAGDPEAASLFRWAIDARRQALPARATETPSAASAAPAAPATATEVVAAPAASEPVAAAEPAAIPADDPVARGVQRLLDAQQARRDAAQAEKDAKKAELERRARVRAERAEAGRRKAAEAKARVAAETAVEPEAVAEPVAQPQPEAAPAVQAEPAPEPVQDEAARIQERIRRSEGSTGRERVRMVEPDTTVRKRIARAAAKLGRKVQFIAVEKSSGVIRGFVSPDSDTIYLAVLPVQAERQSPEQVVESYYLQALLHENAHLSLEDGAIRDRVDGVITDQLKLEFASRFDLGGDAEAVREEVRVYTLTQDIVGSSGAADIVLGEGIASAVSARIKELFAKALPFLPNARRKALLASMIKEQVRQAKAAKPKPLTAASLNAAVAAGDTVTATTERGGEMREVSYGKDAEFIERKGVLYAKQGKTLDRLDSPAVVPAKPAVGKAKAKKATPKPEPKPQAKPKRGRGETGDGQGVLFMREIGGFTTFSGGGLMDIAMEQMGIRSDGRIEIRGDIAAVADQNLPGVTTVLSILDADPAAASRSDILHGSPVCKGYSCANATNHERELDILTAKALMRFLETNRNPIFTLENVRKYGRPDSEAMNLVKATLDRLGYTYDINVPNAADYGAAQFRERLMLRAVRDGDLPPMPEPTHGPGRANPYVGWFERVSDLIDELPNDTIPLRSKDGTKPSYIAERLARIGIDPMNVSEPMLLQGGSASSSNLPIARASEPSWTVKSTHKEAHRILMPGGIVKRVTPRVLARLQGMPDSYKLPNDIALATTIVGNGVPVELGRAVLGSLVGPMVQSDGGLRFMRERSDSQLAADHVAAFERGDAEAATAIVREYGRRKGYAYFGYHGGGTEFMEFLHPWERAERDGEDYESDGYDGGNLGTGFYFTPDRHYASKFGVARSFLLRMSNPIDSTDPDTMSFLEELEQSMIEDTGDVSPGEVYDAAMDERGADGVIAKDAGGFSFGAVEYMVRESTQIKLADPFTYDKDGKLIPLDKRFDDSTGDIRFMRERPAVASVKRFLSRIAPGSEFADNLATSFVWEYAILDREINRVAKEYGLEDEYRANDMLKVSPGKRAAAMLDFQNREVRPFEAAAEGLAKRTGMPVDLVLDKIKEYAFYVQSQDASKVLQAKAGENRNDVLKRAERLAAESGMSEDLALVEVWDNMTSLGLTPEDAAEGQARLEREFASDPMWMELVDRLRAMNRRTLELKREAGLITEESYQKLRSRYPNFVPVVRSIYDKDVDVDGTTYLPKNIKKRATRILKGGQIVEESKLRSFWGASLAITQLDRNSAINQAARNSADNVLFLLSNQVDLETGEPIVGVTEDGETIGLQTRSGTSLLEPVYVDEEVRKVITRASVRAKTPRREDESVEEYRKRIDREVAFAQGQAMADMRTKLNNEASGEKPTLRRFKLDRDLDLTPPEIYQQAEQIMSSPDGLSDAERENNAKLEKRIADERARLASPEFAARVAEIDREIASLEASRRPGVDSTGIDARIDMLKKEKLLPKRRINSARSRMVRARNAEQREEARASLLERKQRLFKKGEVMYYRINDPTLAQAMLVMRKTRLEQMAESPLAAARVVAKGWFGVMSMMRFAYVQASLGFLVGEMQRSPRQATIMARILAAEYDLDAETSDKFIKGLAGKVGGGAWNPLTPVFGAIKALPRNKASKSIYRIMRGETPSNDYERMVRQAIEDGILQGQLYSVDSFELARKRVVADLKRLETGDVGGLLGNAKKATRFVGETLDLTLTAIDLVNRMHVYTAAVEAGISRQTATVMARESLVDFAKKGTAARGIGQVLLFFSPRMQGIHQLTRSFSMLRSTGTRLAVRALAASFLWSFVSAMARELFYEDDEDASTMISKFAAERNLIIPAWMDSETGEWKWVQIAEPYGFGAVSRAGTAVADMLVGDVSPVKTFATVAGAFASEVMPLTVYDPTSLQSWLQAGFPTALSPLLDVAINTDSLGSPIAPLGAQFGAGEPRRSEQYFADTPLAYIKAAALLSAITAPIGRALGGPGARGLEVSPNTIEYLVGRFLPGVAKDAIRMVELGSDYAKGSTISINEVPVLSKVVGESGGRRVLPGQFRDIDAVFERIRTDLRYESRADVLGGASTLERWLASNQFWPNAKRALKALQQRRNELLRAGNRVDARKIEDRMNVLRERAVNQALRIQNIESGPGYDTRAVRYFRGTER